MKFRGSASILFGLVVGCFWISFASIAWGQEIGIGDEAGSFAHNDMVSSVAFSPDGTYLLTGSSVKTVRLREVESGEEIRGYKGSYSRDGQDLQHYRRMKDM